VRAAQQPVYCVVTLPAGSCTLRLTSMPTVCFSMRRDVAHGLWFDAVLAAHNLGEIDSSCRLFDFRFARTVHHCVSDSITLVPAQLEGGEPESAADELSRHDGDDGGALWAAEQRSRYCSRQADLRRRWPPAVFYGRYLDRLQSVHSASVHERRHWPISVCGTTDMLNEQQETRVDIKVRKVVPTEAPGTPFGRARS
jgi:hypothetical protein